MSEKTHEDSAVPFIPDEGIPWLLARGFDLIDQGKTRDEALAIAYEEAKTRPWETEE